MFVLVLVVLIPLSWPVHCTCLAWNQTEKIKSDTPSINCQLYRVQWSQESRMLAIKPSKIHTTKISFYRKLQQPIDHNPRILMSAEVCITSGNASWGGQWQSSLVQPKTDMSWTWKRWETAPIHPSHTHSSHIHSSHTHPSYTHPSHTHPFPTHPFPTHPSQTRNTDAAQERPFVETFLLLTAPLTREQRFSDLTASVPTGHGSF